MTIPRPLPDQQRKPRQNRAKYVHQELIASTVDFVVREGAFDVPRYSRRTPPSVVQTSRPDAAFQRRPTSVMTFACPAEAIPIPAGIPQSRQALEKRNAGICADPGPKAEAEPQASEPGARPTAGAAASRGSHSLNQAIQLATPHPAGLFHRASNPVRQSQALSAG
jgi:hypothetical protein